MKSIHLVANNFCLILKIYLFLAVGQIVISIFFIMYSYIGSFCVFLMLHHFSVLLFHAFLSFSQLFFYPCFLKTKSVILGEIIKRILILISDRTLKRPDIMTGRIYGAPSLLVKLGPTDLYFFPNMK